MLGQRVAAARDRPVILIALGNQRGELLLGHTESLRRAALGRLRAAQRIHRGQPPLLVVVARLRRAIKWILRGEDSGLRFEVRDTGACFLE